MENNLVVDGFVRIVDLVAPVTRLPLDSWPSENTLDIKLGRGRIATHSDLEDPLDMQFGGLRTRNTLGILLQRLPYLPTLSYKLLHLQRRQSDERFPI